jgi:hypothetical protein
MKFFVAKVNLAEQAKTGFSMLRPLQFAYESEKFMLPIRLGMANANGPQDLIAYMLTKNGRVETSNYRTVKMPANMDLPVFLKQGDEFRNFYKGMFGEQAKKEGFRIYRVLLGYGLVRPLRCRSAFTGRIAQSRRFLGEQPER